LVLQGRWFCWLCFCNSLWWKSWKPLESN